MCLSKTLGVPSRRWGIGWKVFRVRRGKLHFDVMCSVGEPSFWISRAVKKSIHHEQAPGFYTSGFHIFLHRKDAMDWLKLTCGSTEVVRPVLYFGARILGEQEHAKVVVADYMII